MLLLLTLATCAVYLDLKVNLGFPTATSQESNFYVHTVPTQYFLLPSKHIVYSFCCQAEAPT